MLIPKGNSQTKTIGVDIDNVLTDTDFVIRKLIEQEYGIKSSREQITNWQYSKSLPITREQEKLVFDLFHSQYCLQAPAIQFAEESLTTLSTEYSIWLITCRPYETKTLTKQWLRKHKITYDKLIHSCKKTDFFKKFTFIIEDNGKTAIEYANNEVPVIIFNKPWNTEFVHSMIFRVDNWHHALDIIAENQFFYNFKSKIIT